MTGPIIASIGFTAGLVSAVAAMVTGMRALLNGRTSSHE